MAKRESMVELKFLVSAGEEYRFEKYVDRHKLEKGRQAFVHFLSLAENADEKQGSKKFLKFLIFFC